MQCSALIDCKVATGGTLLQAELAAHQVPISAVLVLDPKQLIEQSCSVLGNSESLCDSHSLCNPDILCNCIC